MNTYFKQTSASPEEKPERIAPKKVLGQNFLKDKTIAQKIVNSLPCDASTHIIEIGPGEGALTELLLTKSYATYSAIEVDKRAVELLERRFPKETHPLLRVIHTDFLRAKGSDIFPEDGKKISVIGNIPYYITSDILFSLFENTLVSNAVIMMQKEVAQRLTALPRTKEYGILSVAAKFSGKVKLLFHVSPGCFFPKPNVTSSVVAFDFTMNSRRVEYNTIRSLVRSAFGQRRKMLSNALQQYVTERYNKPWQALVMAESSLAEYGHKRAEELTPDDFFTLHLQLEAANGRG